MFVRVKEIILEKLDDIILSQWLSSQSSHYLTKPTNRDILTYILGLAIEENQGQKYIIYNIKTYNLKAGEDPLKWGVQNKQLNNRAAFLFQTHEQALRFVMDMKQKFHPKYFVSDARQVAQRDWDLQQQNKNR